MSDHVLFSFALVISILGLRVSLWQFQGLYYYSFFFFTNLEAFLCLFISFLRWGFHAPDAYSRWGLTMAVYSVSLMDSGHLPTFRRINLRALFAFLVQFSTWSRFFSTFCTPLTSNVNSLMRGAGGVRRHDNNIILVRSSIVNILSYCLLSASAFSLPAVISLPSTLSTGIPVVSLRFVLT